MERFRSPMARPWLMAGTGLLALLIAVGVVAAQAGDTSQPVAVVPAPAAAGVDGAAHPAAFYALHNATSCEVPDAVPIVAGATSPAVPTAIHLHNMMCEPTEGPDAALPVPTAPLPDAVATANFTPLPWPTMPPGPTPIADLGTLAAQSDAVARVRIKGENGASGEWILYVDVLQWISKPDRGPLTYTTIWVSTDRDYSAFYDYRTLPTRPPDWQDDGNEDIVFLQAQGFSPWDKQPDYHPTDLYASFFRVRDGRIAEAGIARYQGWTLAAFEQAVRSALPARLRGR